MNKYCCSLHVNTNIVRSIYILALTVGVIILLFLHGMFPVKLSIFRMPNDQYRNFVENVKDEVKAGQLIIMSLCILQCVFGMQYIGISTSVKCMAS